jgi:phospho-N-acetylmuramoyl-pentapeptide-transferase
VRGAPEHGRNPDRRHGLDADLHLPRAEIHRIPARARVRAAHPRGRPAGAPRQGGDADDGRADHLRLDLRPVPGALRPRRLGFADDYIKIIKRRSLGLSGRYKLLGQLVLSLFLWYVARHSVGLEPRLYIRIGGGSIYLGPLLYFVLVFLVIAGTSNGVNLTDGLDGLAAGSCAIVLLTYTAIAFVANGQPDLALLGCCLVGACIGFLWYNAFPASIFMGDTGSLGLGGAIGAMAVMTQTEVLLIIIGGIFVIEALSVLLQVFSFRTFRRRIFLMAPLHHHFEMMAWSETKIMLRFWIIAAVCSGIGFTLYQHSIGH